MADVKQGPSPVPDLAAALQRARESEAAHYQARLTFDDAKLLRLSALWDELAPAFAAAPAGLVMAELAAKPGEEPRLWVDLVTSVVMAPDPRTYRLIRDGDAGRETICETARLSEISACVKTYLAHRHVAAARQPAPDVSVTAAPPHSLAYLMLAAVAGFAAGAATVLAIINLLKY